MSAMSTDRNTWPYTTPSGHTHYPPRTYTELKARHADAAQAQIEGWDEPEHPPEPRWDMLGFAHREVEKLERRNVRLQNRVDRMSKIINKPDPDRFWREAGLIAVGVVVGMWVAWSRSA